MQLILFPYLSTRSRRAIRRAKTRFGIPYDYKPRGDLIENLAAKTGMTESQVYEQLMNERKYLLTHD